MTQNIAQPAFAPVGKGTVSLSVTGSTGRVQVQTNHQSRHVRIYNSGSVLVFLEFGDVTVTAATATGMPLPPGAVEVYSCPNGYVAAIGASAGPTVIYMTPGEGV